MIDLKFKTVTDFYRLLCFFSAIILPVIGYILNRNFPSFIDPIEIRWALFSWYWMLVALSYLVANAQKYFLTLLYVTIGGVIVWTNYLLAVNGVHPIYLFLLFFAMISCSLVLESHKSLRIFLLTYVGITVINILWSDLQPLDKVLDILALSMVSMLDYLALTKFIQNRIELSRINSNYKTLVDNVDASLFLINKDFKIIECNQRSLTRTAQIFGTPLVPGTDIRPIIPKSEFIPFTKTVEHVLEGKTFELNHKLSLFNDIPKWYQMRFIPIMGDEITVLFIIRNIDKEKKREESIEKNNKELIKVNAELDSFLYRSTHDLRAPLTSILGLVNVCQLEDDKANFNNHLDMIKSSVLKLDHLIGDILDYSKNSNSEIKTENINFKSVVDDVFSIYSSMDFQKKIKKNISIESNGEFNSDPTRLKLIFNNLIANAYKYHNPDGENPFINVDIKPMNDGVEIVIEDNGQGIETKHLDKIFNIFFRAHFQSQGSGLGLYIVKEALNKIGGEIEVSSRIQKGSRFRILLPDLKSISMQEKLLRSEN